MIVGIYYLYIIVTYEKIAFSKYKEPKNEPNKKKNPSTTSGH